MPCAIAVPCTLAWQQQGTGTAAAVACQVCLHPLLVAGGWQLADSNGARVFDFLLRRVRVRRTGLWALHCFSFNWDGKSLVTFLAGVGSGSLADAAEQVYCNTKHGYGSIPIRAAAQGC